jgi:ketosteroid isomerase-like protein
VLAPGLPPISGKTGMREYVATSFRIPGFKINWTSSAASISHDGKLACLFGDNTVTMDGPDGQSTTIVGRAVTIWPIC